MSTIPNARPRPRLPLRRPATGRWIAGVCRGLSVHLRFPVFWIRLVMVLLALAGGAGLAVYLLWWLTIPVGDPRQAVAENQPIPITRLARRLAPVIAQGGAWRREIMIGLSLVALAVALMAVRAGWNWQQSWVPPVLLALGGLAVAWTNAAPSSAQNTSLKPWQGPGFARLISGIVLVVAGLLVFLGMGTSWQDLISALTAMLVVVLGVGLVLAPWGVRLTRAFGAERSARIREAERADIAAHLHDSVLQTLALIRANSDDAEAVARLARTQERELREWLYVDRPVASDSLATQVRALVAQIEDGSISKTGEPSPPIDVVVVGDAMPDADTAALLSAAQEALVNAVTHGAPPVSVYLEVTDTLAEIYVRDRGAGFDLAQVSPDRLGVRNSIIARMQRRGGSAQIITRPNWGTEIRLAIPRV